MKVDRIYLPFKGPVVVFGDGFCRRVFVCLGFVEIISFL